MRRWYKVQFSLTPEATEVITIEIAGYHQAGVISEIDDMYTGQWVYILEIKAISGRIA